MVTSLHLRTQAVLVLLALGCVFLSAGADSYSGSQTGTPPCSVPVQWLKGEVPEPDPAAFQSDTNCGFHQLSWQYFLWLTESVGDQLRFQTLYSEDAIDPKTKDAKNKDMHLIYQAGSLGILVDHHKRATYTQIFINDVYRDFVLDNGLSDPDTLYAFDADTSFPVGSLSLKASWKILQKGEGNGMFTTVSDVRRLETVDGKIQVSDKVDRDVKLGLIGLHIAVVANGHPEAIWATFEHMDNAPDMYPGQTQVDKISERDYLFYTAATLASDVNQNNASIIALDAGNQTLTPITQVARQYPYGGGNSSNQNNIRAVNQSVSANTQSLWRNYFEVGAVWLLQTDALVPNWSPNVKASPQTTGSTTLSSSVIETFTQNVSSQNDCFSCHNTMALVDAPSNRKMLPGKNVSTSHVLLQHYVEGNPVNR